MLLLLSLGWLNGNARRTFVCQRTREHLQNPGQLYEQRKRLRGEKDSKTGNYYDQPSVLQGFMTLLRKASTWLVPWDEIFPKVSSICRDGGSLNTGDKSSLWALIDCDHEHKSRIFASLVPIKILALGKKQGASNQDLVRCASAATTYKSLHDNVAEVEKADSKATGLATFFDQTGLRTKEFAKLAEERDFKV